MEHFEEKEFDTADRKSAKWLKYIEDTFVVRANGPTRRQDFLHDLSSVRPINKFRT
jgi:hypothetical protein